MNLTPEIEKTIIETITPLCKKYVFDMYDEDDIFQEAFLIAVDGLKGWDRTRPLANFIYVHVNNRLKNLIRDQFATGDTATAQKKKNVKRTKSLEYAAEINFEYDVITELEEKEIWDIIDNEIPLAMRSDLIRVISGVSIPFLRKEKLLEEIRGILEKHGYETGQAQQD